MLIISFCPNIFAVVYFKDATIIENDPYLMRQKMHLNFVAFRKIMNVILDTLFHWQHIGSRINTKFGAITFKSSNHV